MSVIECVSYDTLYHGFWVLSQAFWSGVPEWTVSLDGRLSKQFTGLWRRRREWISGVSKKFPGGPRQSFARFAANGQALQRVDQIIARSGERRTRKKAFTDHNYRCTIPDMPHASRRYASVRRRSTRASAGVRAFDGLSGTLSGQAPGRESQVRMSDPLLLPNSGLMRGAFSRKQQEEWDSRGMSDLDVATAVLMHEILHITGVFESDASFDKEAGTVDTTKSRKYQQQLLDKCFPIQPKP
ncbi:MAG: hypothetical protein K1X36_06355 [Pyrinomonadaceae bacterium]|nr:hypothetical protein [Pyrinomonadaceae bacterium]